MVRLLSTLFVFGSVVCYAQIIDVKKTAQNEATSRTNQAINQGINTGINAIFNAPGKIYRKIKDNKQQQPGNYPSQGDQPVYNSQSNTNQPIVTVNVNTIYGKDFVPGNTVIWSDDFSSATIGKLPTNWHCSGLGEVRSFNNTKWMQLSSDGFFSPETLKNLPENFNLEWDAIFNPSSSSDVHYLIYLYAAQDKVKDFNEGNYPGSYGTYFAFNTYEGEVDAETFENGKGSTLNFHLVTDALKGSLTNKIHIALKKESDRLSLYLNGYEVFSSVINAPAVFDTIKFGSSFMSKDDFMLISNLKVTNN